MRTLSAIASAAFVAMFVGMVAGELPVCSTARDLAVVHTDCVDGLRRVVPYWAHDCRETTADPLPSSRLFSCAAVCPEGYVVGVEGVCAPCPSGTVVANTMEWRAPFHSVPSDAFLQCTAYAGNTTEHPCPPSRWEPCDDGTCLTSGASGGRILYDQDIAMRFTVDRYPASVSFQYKVSSEAYYDYLAVYLDGEAVLVESGEKHADEWRTFTHTFSRSAFQHVSEAEGGQESQPSIQICHWTLGGRCVYPNQLSPYRTNSFFDATEYEGTQGRMLVSFRLDETACPPPLSDVAGRILVWPLPTGAALNHCQPHTILEAARSNSAAGVVFGVPDNEMINGTSRGVIPDPPARFIVGSMRLDDAHALKRLVERHNPNAGVSVRYSARSGIGHRLTFSYSKDGSVDRGSDRAWIRDVVIRGSAGVAKCRRCPPGYTSAEGATDCIPCARNTYGEFDGTPAPCRACASGYMSPPGASQCLRAETCTMADYVPIRSRCHPRDGPAPASGAVNVSADGGGTFAPRGEGTISFVHNITFAALDPPTCNLAESTIQLPPPMVDVPCTACPSMQFRNTQTGHCESCPARTHVNSAGLAAPSAADACSRCGPGSYANQLLMLSSFDSWHNEFPPWVTVTCDKCIGAGWALADSAPDTALVGANVLSVGQAIAAGGIATMAWNITTVASDVLGFTYTLLKRGAGEDGGAVLTFDVLQEQDGANITVYSQRLARPSRIGSPFQVTTGILPSGRMYLVWSYQSTRTNASILEAGDVYGVASASLYGATVGSAPSCMLCPPGHRCPETEAGSGTGAPEPCPVGHYSEVPGAASCKPCPFGYVSSSTGSVTCQACPNGTVASWDKRTCVMPLCVLTDGTLGMVPPALPGSVPVRWSNTPLNEAEAGDAPARIPLNDFQGTTAYPIAGLSSSAGSRLQGVVVHFATCEPGVRQCATSDEPSYGCAQATNGEWFPLGGMLTPLVLYSETGDTIGGQIAITGARCHAQPGRPMTTIITLLCDPQARTHQLVESRAPDPCLYTLRIRSRGACPVCTNRSFVKTQTDCAGDPAVRTTFYDYAFRNGTISREPTCVPSEPDTDPRPGRETEACPWVSVNFGKEFSASWLVAGLVVVISLVLIVVAVCSVVSRNRMASKYNRLRAEGNVPVSALGDPARRSRTHGDDRANAPGAVEMDNNDLHPAVSRIVEQRKAVAADANGDGDAGAGAAPRGAKKTDEVSLRSPAKAPTAGTNDVVEYSDDGENATDDRRESSRSPQPSANHAV